MLTDEIKTRVKDWLDDLTDWNGWKEFVSDIAINRGVPILDSQVFDRYIEQQYADEFNAILGHLLDKNYTLAIPLLKDIMNDLINLPNFTEEQEGRFFYHSLGLLEVTLEALTDEETG